MDERRLEWVVPHGRLQLPTFLPDATRGVVRSLDASDVASCGVQALVMNVFHLMQRPGSGAIKALGGLHGMFGWDGPILTDSGGFQAYSLIRQNPRQGSFSDQGLMFRPEGSTDKIKLTPEKSIQLQMQYGADIVVCLDDCTNVEAPLDVQRESVRRTIKWAKRCKEEYSRRQDAKGGGARPLLMGVVQGGGVPELRRECAEALLEIGFDGYGLGGWPLDAAGNLLREVVGYLRELIPLEFPLHALGVGHPQYILDSYRLGYDVFDSAMPTRDARHGRLLAYAAPPEQVSLHADRWFSYVYMQDERHIRDGGPVSPYCDALCCRRYSRAFLHHLFKVGDSLFFRLATLHNLRFITQLMERLRRDRQAVAGEAGGAG
ncbi:MAG: tRNA-ribosyltransferase family protein [Anaerolineae bacterium]